MTGKGSRGGEGSVAVKIGGTVAAPADPPTRHPAALYCETRQTSSPRLEAKQKKTALRRSEIDTVNKRLGFQHNTPLCCQSDTPFRKPQHIQH